MYDVLLAPSRLVKDEVYRQELTGCTCRDMARFVTALVLLAEHEKAVHGRQGSIAEVVVSIVRALNDPRQEDKFNRAIALAILAAGYDPDDDDLSADAEPAPAVSTGGQDNGN